MNKIEICDGIKYIGVNDSSLELFEGQYRVKNGMAYNSYLIMDDKTVVMDTVDERAEKEWFANLERELCGRVPDYLAVLHAEPDHAANIKKFIDKYPNTKIIGNVRTVDMINQFFDTNVNDRAIIVSDGEEICFGKHTLKFITAFMVHWPEVMVAYEKENKVLFSADAFGKFGTRDLDEDWLDEARRYYFNIVGKYGAAVQKLLSKLEGLEIKTICSLHGPILRDNIGYYVEKYKLWSSYKPEKQGIAVVYASIHGNTRKAAEALSNILKESEETEMFDLVNTDISEAISGAFCYDKMIIAAATYETGVFTPMYVFLHQLKSKNYQNRKVGIIENGSWCPMAAKIMKSMLDKMDNIEIVEPVVTIKSALNEKILSDIKNLAKEIRC